MFTHIRTSKENKEVVSQLTRKLNLGAENIISRIALTYSLSKDRVLDIKDIQNSSGKEYSDKVLFGDFKDLHIFNGNFSVNTKSNSSGVIYHRVGNTWIPKQNLKFDEYQD